MTVTAAAASATAGSAFTVTVTARTVSDNVATGYTGTVHLTSTDGQAVLPADSTPATHARARAIAAGEHGIAPLPPAVDCRWIVDCGDGWSGREREHPAGAP